MEFFSLSFIENLFEYNQFSNEKILKQFESQRDSNASDILRLFSHLLNAHHIWMHRIMGNPPMYAVWQEHTWEECRLIHEANYKLTRELLPSLDFGAVIEYKNSTGQIFANKIGDILFHVINHGTYHRAQIATRTRLLGMNPQITDYIFYKR